jgi:hypothetical protein
MGPLVDPPGPCGPARLRSKASENALDERDIWEFRGGSLRFSLVCSRAPDRADRPTRIDGLSCPWDPRLAGADADGTSYTRHQ